MSASIVFIAIIFVLLLILCIVILAMRAQLQKTKGSYELQLADVVKKLEISSGQAGTAQSQLAALKSQIGEEVFDSLLIAHINQGVVAVDNRGIVRVLNPYASQHLNLGATLGMPYEEVLHLRKSGSSADETSLFDAAKSGETQIVPPEYQIVSSHGTFPVTGTVLAIGDGAFAFIFEDSTQSVERVHEEQAFFSAAAHELRTPLTVIRMTISLLKEKFDSLPREKVLEHLRRTDETTARLVKLVNDFLNISRIDQGRVDIKHESFDIVALTDDVIRDLSLLAKERSLYIHHEATVERRMVIGDKAKSIEVLANLISNGLKYTVQGGITITHVLDGAKLVTRVTDTGSGIPKEYQSLLFKRFQRVGEGHLQAPTKSSGFGLYISKKFAQLMAGDIALEKSEPGAGSTFTFTLPLG